MRRSGIAWPWMLLLFGSACGDSVVVARGVTLVSAAQSSDAGLEDAGDHEPHHFGVGGGSFDHHPGAHHSMSGTGGSNSNGSTDNSKHHD
jgi:hypothetical protein